MRWTADTDILFWLKFGFSRWNRLFPRSWSREVVEPKAAPQIFIRQNKISVSACACIVYHSAGGPDLTLSGGR